MDSEDKSLERLFSELGAQWDTETPKEGHRERFANRLNMADGPDLLTKKDRNWWKPLSIAASLALLMALAYNLFTPPSLEEKVAQISPEVSQTHFYFTNLIEQQVRQLEDNETPDTKRIVDDALIQLKHLEQNYMQMERDLVEGGNSKLILSAMIKNFQTRIDLLNEVLEQIETIKNQKNNEHEKYTT